MKKINYFSALTVATLFLGMSLTSCEKDKKDPYEGKTNPSTIATANLVGYFPLDSETASISIGAGVTYSKKMGAASFVDGRRGSAYKGSTAQAFLEYTLASTNIFKSMNEYTCAFWLKSPAPTGGAASVFAVNGGDVNMGNLNFMIESQSNADSLALKPYLYNSTTNWKGQDVWSFTKAYSSDKWVHIVSSYNKTTSTMSLYANGVFVVSSIRYADGEVNGVQPKLGALTFGTDMSKFNIGAWPKLAAGTATDAWMVYFPGAIDELRIYNKALTTTEVKALYNAEVTVID